MGGKVTQRPHERHEQRQHAEDEEAALTPGGPAALPACRHDVGHHEGGDGQGPKEVEVPVEGLAERGHGSAAAVGSARWLARYNSTDSNA